ncbi:diaminobutyrate acetyltransferase [Oceanobacillus sojae]|uniref:diaminobutyrate acetyltransferase n=1 Tax=Oceanobacillus sojae TaxID=582851 RepID=UPI0021A370C7|nr:diaminobutyrate acetyltransferase [Oceanobacillus sojae]MCT1903034.1 diaminobutyrate acetyltransferase [Oceanobacillus sojae]
MVSKKIHSGGESINTNTTNETTLTVEFETDFYFRKPVKDDGAAVWELIKNSKVLDLNSSYSYLMWCDIFSETSIVAEKDGKTLGFISGYKNPNNQNKLFIWQVAVDASARGNGLATKMLLQLLKRKACKDIDYVEATVSPANQPSQALFKGLAEKLDTDCQISDYFIADDFPDEEEEHEDELLFTVGPIAAENK